MALSRSLSRRTFLQLAGTAGGAAALAACGVTPAPQAGEGTVTTAVPEAVEVSQAAESQPVLRYTTDWFGGVRGELTNQFLAKWKDEVHPDIPIAYEPCPRVQDRLRVEFAAGTPPDVMLFAPELFAPFADQLLVLDPFWEEAPQEWKDDVLGIDPSFYLDGHLMGLPFQHNIVCHAINIDLFEQAGVPMPWEYDHDGDNWWDWNDFLESCKAIQALGDDIYGHDIGGSTYMHWGPWIRTNGGEYIRPAWPNPGDTLTSALAEPEAVEALTFLANLVCKEDAAVPVDVAASLQQTLQISPYAAGKVGVRPWTVEGSIRREMNEAGFRGSRVVSPRSPHTKYSRYHQGNCPNVASGKTSFPTECWEFLKFLDSDWCQREIGLQGGSMPGLKSAYEDPEYMVAYMDGFPPEATEALKIGMVEYECMPGNFVQFEEWRYDVEAIAMDMLVCNTPPEQAIAEMDAAATAILSRPT